MKSSTKFLLLKINRYAFEGLHYKKFRATLNFFCFLSINATSSIDTNNKLFQALFNCCDDFCFNAFKNIFGRTIFRHDTGPVKQNSSFTLLFYQA